MEKDMTVGSPAKILIFFTLPMLLGNIFQQLYNIVDTIVVGNYVGADALAAVGASTALVLLLLCLAIGLSMGCSVLVSQYFGAGKLKEMRQAVFVSLIFIITVGIIASLLCVIFAENLLAMIRTPQSIFADARTYFVIYCWGGVFTFIYNALSALCRALGDSKTPLYFLIVASVINIGLDLYFVIALHMGVAGVAWATIIAQGISAISCGIYVYARVPALRIKKEDCVFSWKMLGDLVRYAIPSTIQQSIVSISIIAVQGLVNGFDTATIAGYTAACKIDQFATQPLLSLGMAITSYTAQNIGADQYDRIKQGFHVAIIIVLVMCGVISGAIWIFGDNLIGLFVDSVISADVISAGVEYIRIVSIFYVLMGLMFCSQNILRGAGDMFWYMVGTLSNFAVRIGLAYILSGTMGFAAVAYSIPAGWVVGIIVSYARYKQGGWKNKAVVRV